MLLLVILSLVGYVRFAMAPAAMAEGEVGYQDYKQDHSSTAAALVAGMLLPVVRQLGREATVLAHYQSFPKSYYSEVNLKEASLQKGVVAKYLLLAVPVALLHAIEGFQEQKKAFLASFF